MKKIILTVILAIIVLLAAVVGIFTVAEYKPAAVETVEITGTGSETLAPGDSISVITWNTGFAALDATRDFFLDGGSIGSSETAEDVQRNLDGMIARLQDGDYDIMMLQEVDLKAKRTFRINEVAQYVEALGGTSAFAKNYDALFVPLPLNAPMAQVTSGLQIITVFDAENAERISLPDAHSWPISTCQLKRCLLKQEIPLEGTDKKLVLINLHLEAYAEGDKKAAQTDQLHALVLEEYEKGNYVIAGGDFNQSMPGIDETLYPILSDAAFQAHPIDVTTLPEGFSYVSDDSVPSTRLLNEPYNGNWETTQLYVIDGFLVSPNVQVDRVECLNEEFFYTDHNPVVMEVTLLEN